MSKIKIPNPAVEVTVLPDDLVAAAVRYVQATGLQVIPSTVEPSDGPPEDDDDLIDEESADDDEPEDRFVVIIRTNQITLAQGPYDSEEAAEDAITVLKVSGVLKDGGEAHVLTLMPPDGEI